MRGDIHRLRAPRNTRGSEQSGVRYAVILQSDDLILSTVLVAPTSTSARPASFRPSVMIGPDRTQVLIEQTAAVTPERMGELVGHVSRQELDDIEEALRLVFELS